jgi:hypothetical protein
MTLILLFMVVLTTAFSIPFGPNLSKKSNSGDAVEEALLTTACNIDNIAPPVTEVEPALPKPPSGQTLLYLTVGRGTQVCDFTLW